MLSEDQYGILNRLILNDPIAPSPEGVLRLLGFVHVYSASGLHLIALESFLQKFFGRTLAARKILTVCFLFFLILIWKLQGFRLGFARVLVLFFLKALAKEKGFRWRVYYPLFLAFCFDFAMGIDSGWQHYYLAILGGMVGLELAQKRSVFIQHVYLSVASWLMTAPLDLWIHHTISWMTPIWSLITIPVIALFLYPLSVISYLCMGRIPSVLMNIWNGGMDVLFQGVDHGLTFSVVNHQVLMISLGMALFSGIIFHLLRENRSRINFCIFATILLGIISQLQFFKSDRLQLVQLDVGQGDSLLVKKNNHVDMIDLGTSQKVKPESMILRLAPYGINHVDTVLFSHLDEDHAGGVRLLLPWVMTDHLEMNPQLERTSKIREWMNKFPQTSWCASGCFKSGAVDWISSGARSKMGTVGGNDLMATARIPLSSQEIYLALGDSDSKQEAEFWNRHHVEIQGFPRRILKISHHGSKNSSTETFIHQINPIQTVISVGFHNRYHHPHYSVMNELNNNHIPIHRTDQDGDYSIEL